MQRRTLVVLAAVSSAVAAVHCSSDEKKDEGGASSSDRVGGPGQPPAPAKDAPAASGAGLVVAMSKIWVGDTDEDFAPGRDAWKAFGHNIDGLVSSPSDRNHCTPKEFGDPEEIQVDGPDGIDNSFGQHVLYKLSSIAKGVSYGITRAIDLGQVTFVIKLANLGTGATQSKVDTLLYGGGFRLFDGQAPGTIFDASPDSVTDTGLVVLPDGHAVDPVCQFCEPPVWSGEDLWPIVYETVENGSLDAPKLRFPDGYVVNGTYVVQPTESVLLSIPLRGVALDLVIQSPLISFDVVGEGADAKVMKGVISGVLDAEGMFETFKKAAGAIDPGFCGPINLLKKPILQSADILLDGTQDPKKECNGVSIGIGFEGLPVKLGELTDPSPPAKEVCK